MKFLFYGSLKSGLHNNRLLDRRHCTLIGPGATKPCFQLWSLGAYPAMTEGDKQVNGEIWSVNDPAIIGHINRMEEGAGYKAEEIDLVTGERVWCYIMQITTAKRNDAIPVEEWPIRKNEIVNLYNDRELVEELTKDQSPRPLFLGRHRQVEGASRRLEQPSTTVLAH